MLNLFSDFRTISERKIKTLKDMLADEKKELLELFVADNGNRSVLTGGKSLEQS